MSTTPTPVGTPIGNFDQPVLGIGNPASFDAVHAAIEAAFAAKQAAAFLKSVDRAGLRIRHFEDVLDKGLLGAPARADYAKLGNADQGQIREFYLARLEQVAPELRNRFFKLYAYY